MVRGAFLPRSKLRGVCCDAAQIPARKHRPHDDDGAVSTSYAKKPAGDDISLCDTDLDVDTQSAPSSFHRLKKACMDTPFPTPPSCQKKGLSFSEVLAVRAF